MSSRVVAEPQALNELPSSGSRRDRSLPTRSESAGFLFVQHAPEGHYGMRKLPQAQSYGFFFIPGIDM